MIDDVFGDMIDKEIEHSMVSNNTSLKKRKQQVTKTKLEHEGASAISQSIAESREFASFRADILRRMQTTLMNLVENFDDEFPVTLNSSTASALPGLSNDTIVTDHGTILGTSYDLDEIINHRPLATTGGGSSAYNVSYGSDSENSYTNGSVGRHVRDRDTRC